MKYLEVAHPPGESEQWKAPPLDTSIFYIDREHEASFKVKIPTQLLDELADQAEEHACKANNIKTNTKR